VAEVPVMINGVVYDKQWRTARPVVFYGMASYADREIGGGPVYPPDQGGGGEPPYPQFPIAGYPDFPYPSQPIYRPGYPGGSPPPSGRPPEQPPEGPVDDSGFIKPPVEGQASWAYHSEFGWGWYPSGAAAGPKK
jgi:hypothetical protein